MNKDTVYIIGTGIAGLSISEFLNLKDNVVFFDKNNYFGGRIKSIQHNSSYFEIGSQFFCKSDKNIWKLLDRKHLHNDRVKLDFSNISFYYKNKLLDNLDEIVEIITHILEQKSSDSSNIYFDEWFLKYFDKDKIYIPKGVIRAVTFNDSANTVPDYGKYILETFFDDCFTLKFGLEQLIHSLSDNISVKNNRIQKLVFNGNKIVEIISDEETLDVCNAYVVNTAPPGNFEVVNHEKLKRCLGSIRFNGCVVLFFKVRHSFSEYAEYVFFPEKKYKISVIEQMKLEDDEFIGCLLPYDSRLQINQKEIEQYCIDFLSNFFKCKFDELILDVFYEDWIDGLPIVDNNYRKNIHSLHTINFDNFALAGDFVEKNPSMDSAVKSGITIAKKIMKNQV